MPDALGTVEGVARALNSEIEEEERGHIEWMLSKASDVVRAYCRRDFADPVPGPVARVVEGMVARSLEAGDYDVAPGTSNLSHTEGPYSQSATFAGGWQGANAPWLSKTDRQTLRGWRGGAFSVQM